MRDATGAAMERWLEAGKGRDQQEASRAFAEIGPIAGKYWGEIFERMWEAYRKPAEGKDILAAQRNLHLASVASLNEMMKEIMGTKAFASWTGDSVEAYLKAKIASDRMMEEVLKAMRIPTKTDFDDLYASIRSLSAKVDALTVHRAPGRTGRSAREGDEA